MFENGILLTVLKFLKMSDVFNAISNA